MIGKSFGFSTWTSANLRQPIGGWRTWDENGLVARVCKAYAGEEQGKRTSGVAQSVLGQIRDRS